MDVCFLNLCLELSWRFIRRVVGSVRVSVVPLKRKLERGITSSGGHNLLKILGDVHKSELLIK